MGFGTPSIRLRNRRDSLRFSVGDTVRIPVSDLLPDWVMERQPLGTSKITVVKVDHRRGMITMDVR